MPNLWSISFLLFLLCASAGAGYFVKSRLPERHRSRDAIELVQLSVTLLATFTAIVLGLLTTSVKAGFDAAYTARGTYAAELAQMEQCLRDYGAETAPIREQLQSYVAAVIASTWPDEKPPSGVAYPDTSEMPLTGESHVLGAILNDVGREVRALHPADVQHERTLNACMQQYSDLTKSRWAVIEGARGSISTPFYWVLVFWLVILFACSRPHLAARRPDRYRHCALRDLRHRRRLRDPRSRPALRRPLRHSEHVNAQRAVRHGALIRRRPGARNAKRRLPRACSCGPLLSSSRRHARDFEPPGQSPSGGCDLLTGDAALL